LINKIAEIAKIAPSDRQRRELLTPPQPFIHRVMA